jgi:hypothetical protein
MTSDIERAQKPFGKPSGKKENEDIFGIPKHIFLTVFAKWGPLLEEARIIAMKKPELYPMYTEAEKCYEDYRAASLARARTEDRRKCNAETDKIDEAEDQLIEYLDAIKKYAKAKQEKAGEAKSASRKKRKPGVKQQRIELRTQAVKRQMDKDPFQTWEKLAEPWGVDPTTLSRNPILNKYREQKQQKYRADHSGGGKFDKAKNEHQKRQSAKVKERFTEKLQDN